MKSDGFLFVLSGPSGVGKGSVCNILLEENYNDIVLSVSQTTRAPREGEVQGLDYIFVDEDEFKSTVYNGGLLEYANVHGNYYGTPKKFVEEKIAEGSTVLLEIDVQGAMQIKENFKNAVFVFMLPPSMKELRKRIVGRGTETADTINLRMNNSLDEIDQIYEYDYVVVNEDINQCVKDLQTIIEAEKQKTHRNKYKIDKIKKG